MRRPFKGRPTVRQQREAINRTDAFYAAMHNKAPAFQTELKPVRKYTKSDKPGEASVNDAIYECFKKHPCVTLYRNNRGVAKYGNYTVRYGVGPNGAADWIGYRILTITPDMVGQRIAQFVSLESKRPGEIPDIYQAKWAERVNADGGCAGWADSAAKAEEVINKL